MKALKNSVLSRVAALSGALSTRVNLQRLVFNAARLDRPEIRSIIADENIRFLSYCIARRDRTRSQIFQDLWVCYELGEREGGYFVEFGATNGLKNSNTWLLEKKLSWTGILAEPNPIWHAELAANRNAAIESKCVYSRSGEIVSFLTTDDTDPELSGIASFSDADHFAETRRKARKIDLETISLDDLLTKYDAPATIDYMSIDTEGSEFDILSSYSFRHRFKLISVENNPKNERLVDDLLVSKGYVRVFRHFSQWDSWYVASDLRDGQPLRFVAPEA